MVFLILHVFFVGVILSIPTNGRNKAIIIVAYFAFAKYVLHWL